MLQFVLYWFAGVAVFFAVMYGAIRLGRRMGKGDSQNDKEKGNI